MAKRFDETDNFINTVLTEANWTQANIKVKLTEESEAQQEDEESEAEQEGEKSKAQQEDEDSRRAGRGPGIVTTGDGRAINASEVADEDIKDSTEYTYGYDACPLCESELENDDVIFENIDTHFNSLVNLLHQVQAISESDDFDGNEIVIESNDTHNCPLCESVVEDDSIVMQNMNEHFDVLLEMLDEMEQVQEASKKPMIVKKNKKKWG